VFGKAKRRVLVFMDNNMKKSRKAVVLLSGGLDSSTVLYYAIKKGYECICLFFDYAQRHKKEVKSARQLAKSAGVKLQIVKISLPWTKSSLINKWQKIPAKNDIEKTSNVPTQFKQLPSTYVPGRNTIFISFAQSLAESIGAQKIFIGANAVDYSGYPDCRPKYYKALNCVLKEIGAGIKIEAPLINLNKTQIIKLGQKLGVPFEKTWSCYKGEAKPCGVCDSCRFRTTGFSNAGAIDPVEN